jgi:hypothetical protein
MANACSKPACRRKGSSHPRLHTILVSLITLWTVTGVLLAQVVPLAATADARAIRLFEEFMARFQSGRVDFTNPGDRLKQSVLFQRRHLDADHGRLTAQQEARYLIDRLVAAGGPEETRALLRAGATAADPSPTMQRHGSHVLQQFCDEALSRCTKLAARDVLLRAARGLPFSETGQWDSKDRRLAEAVRVLALPALGSHGEPVFRPTLTTALEDPAARVRRAAAEGLRRLRHDTTVAPLASALGRETDPSVALALVHALQASLDAAKDRPAQSTDAPTGQEAHPFEPEAVTAVLGSLGRFGGQVDLQLLPLLRQHRRVESVPALIAFLEGQEHGRPAPQVVDHVHLALCDLTGAGRPANGAAGWRQFWESEQATFRIARRPDPNRFRTTVASTFFGIPSTGQRVVFVLDLSGSMSAAMQSPETGTRAGPPTRTTRLDVAKQQLLACVDGLAETTYFNVVMFDGDVRIWSDNLVPATAGQRKQLRDDLARLQPSGGTNLWGGLQRAFGLRVSRPAERYALPVDEVFLLSDGMPTVGEVTDPHTILDLTAERLRVAPLRLHTIFLGRDVTTTGRRTAAEARMTGAYFMQQLAALGNGEAVVHSN